jgi:hypothetical protein
MNKNYTQEVNKFACLGSVMASTCGAEEGVNTHIQKASAVYSVLSSMEGQGDIQCNIIEAVVSNVVSFYGCKMQKEYPI